MKYDYLSFFIYFISFLIGGLLVECLFYFIAHMPLFLIVSDIWSLLLRSLVVASVLNLFTNLRQVYNLLDGNRATSKKNKDNKLIKAGPQHRQVTLSSELKKAQEGLAT